MSEKPESPIRPTDAAARELAHGLIAGARHGALGVIDPESGFPMVTRVAVGTDFTGVPLTFISTLSAHTRALARDPRASLLLGEPGAKGDPLTHPRLSLMALAERIDDAEQHAALAESWLAEHPKAQLYIGFADFAFWRFRVQTAHLNGGFGRAFVLDAADLMP